MTVRKDWLERLTLVVSGWPNRNINWAMDCQMAVPLRPPQLAASPFSSPDPSFADSQRRYPRGGCLPAVGQEPAPCAFDDAAQLLIGQKLAAPQFVCQHFSESSALVRWD
jgi:hypothetical protein